jgi:uncharacterized protein (DUF486 family)
MWFILAGILLALAGGTLWWRQERTRDLINPWIALAMALILAGAVAILVGLERRLHLQALKGTGSAVRPRGPADGRLRGWHWAFILGLIFVGSVSYTIAAYYHLKIEHWTFPVAFAIALPLILIEYQFSIRGNRAAYDLLGLNAVQITLLTMAFYFVNAWVLNAVFLRRPVVWWREVLAFACIGAAFVLTTSAGAAGRVPVVAA